MQWIMKWQDVQGSGLNMIYSNFVTALEGRGATIKNFSQASSVSLWAFTNSKFIIVVNAVKFFPLCCVYLLWGCIFRQSMFYPKNSCSNFVPSTFCFSTHIHETCCAEGLSNTAAYINTNSTTLLRTQLLS